MKIKIYSDEWMVWVPKPDDTRYCSVYLEVNVSQETGERWQRTWNEFERVQDEMSNAAQNERAKL